jgi:lysozyme family protein
MTTFDKAFDFMIPNEVGRDMVGGGYTNDPDDPGGETKWGVTHLTLDAFNAKHPENGFPTKVLDLTKDEARVIYRFNYWDGIKGDAIQDEKVAIKLFDAAVNMGPKAAIKLAQKALNMAPHPDGQFLVVDGLIGPKTIEELNTTSPVWFLGEYVRQLQWYYRNLNKPKYLKGWLNRAERLP